MGQMTEAQQKVRELFDAHFTVSEIVERTSLEIQTVVSVHQRPKNRSSGAMPPTNARLPNPTWAWPAIKSHGCRLCARLCANVALGDPSGVPRRRNLR